MNTVILKIIEANGPLWEVKGARYKLNLGPVSQRIVQELCESRGGRPGLSVLTSLLVSVDVKLY